MKKYTKDSIIESIQRFYAINGRIPLSIDFKKNKDYPSDKTVYNHFGSFGKAIETAGFVNTNDKSFSKEEIILAIKKFYLDFNKLPSTRDFTNNKIYPHRDTVIRYFGSWNNAIIAAGFTIKNKSPNTPYFDCSKDGIILAIKHFVDINNKIPSKRDFNDKYPVHSTVTKVFGSWNKAIEAAGFEPNIQNGFGIDTYGRDGHLYRSQAEAYFADNFLFNKIEYEVEPKYPEPYNKWYDWYLPTKNLYIELDGEIRPQVTKEKIEINKLLNRNCLFIKTSDMFNKQSLLDFIKDYI